MKRLAYTSTNRAFTGGRIDGDYWDLDSFICSIGELIGAEDRYYDYQGTGLRISKFCRDICSALNGEKMWILFRTG